MCVCVCEYFIMGKFGIYLVDGIKYNKVWVSIISNEKGIYLFM